MLTKSLYPSKIHYCKLKLVTVVFFIYTFSANAQCAMCRAALESEGNSQKAQAINDGIVYLMAIPYILIGAVGYYVYRMKTKK